MSLDTSLENCKGLIVWSLVGVLVPIELNRVIMQLHGHESLSGCVPRVRRL